MLADTIAKLISHSMVVLGLLKVVSCIYGHALGNFPQTTGMCTDDQKLTLIQNDLIGQAGASPPSRTTGYIYTSIKNISIKCMKM